MACLPAQASMDGWRDVEPLMEASRAPEPPHVTVARLQRADGSWLLIGPLSDVLGVDLEALRAVAETLDAGVEARSLVATVAALCFLERHAADVRDEWRMLAAKAERWLEQALAAWPPGTRERLESRLASLLN
jgi:hypothetical protein